MDEVLIFIDAGFLSKVNNYFGKGKYIQFKIVNFVKNICLREKVRHSKIFFYTAPPFQSTNPGKIEITKKKNYDSFKNALVRDGVFFREGRCQRLKVDGKFSYHQKGVDTLLTMDLVKVPMKYSSIKKVFLIASDSDFVPIINDLQNESDVRVTLCTFFEKKRDGFFSTSNELMKAVSNYVLIREEDFRK